MFLKYIRKDEKASDVLRDLAGAPFKSFIDAGANPVHLWPIRDYAVRHHGRSLLLLRHFLLEWANKWNLNADWVLEYTCWTLSFWQIHSQSLEDLQWSYGGVSWMRLSDRDLEGINPPFELLQWEADNQFRPSYERYAQEKIEEHINQNPFLCGLKAKTKTEIVSECMEQVGSYCDKVLNIYLSMLDPKGNPVWKLAEKRDDFDRNVRWTIKFQVLGESFSKIALEEDKAVSTVKRAVEDTLFIL